jgi:hypothetical protein
LAYEWFRKKHGEIAGWRRSLEIKKNFVLLKLIDNDRDFGVIANDKFFDALASIILQPDQSSALAGESKWTYLITNDQNNAIDRGISRLINSFL